MNSAPPTVPKPRILVVDDDPGVLSCLGRVVREEKLGEPLLCPDPREAMHLLETIAPAVVLLDLIMPGLSGEQLLTTILARQPEIPVLVISAVNDVDTALRCVKAGAFDYLVKPVDLARLTAGLRSALRHHEVQMENRRLREAAARPTVQQPAFFSDIVTQSPLMLSLFRHVEAIAPSPYPVLITGETGTGKELLAQAVHRASGRTGPLVALNVAGVDDTAFSDTLFGHMKGAFTGADRDRKGLLEEACDGSLFLDEIGDLSWTSQTKLLRLIQEKEYFPLGSDRCRQSRCRVIVSTNRDLRTLMRQGRFREDLFYRLHAHPVRVPALRERLDDLPLLIGHFLREAAAELGKSPPTVPKELYAYLAAYHFPGNVRELRLMISDAVARHTKGVLSLEAFHRHMDAESSREAAGRTFKEAFLIGPRLPTIKEAVHMLTVEALRRANGNQGAAAKLLGVSRKTVQRALAKNKKRQQDS